MIRAYLSAQAHFHYILADECSDEEREVALAPTLGEEIRQDRHPTAFQNLFRKEFVEAGQNGYRLCVEMFSFWILRNGAASGGERVS